MSEDDAIEKSDFRNEDRPTFAVTVSETSI